MGKNYEIIDEPERKKLSNTADIIMSDKTKLEGYNKITAEFNKNSFLDEFTYKRK